MPYKRIHSNGFEVLIDGDPSRRDTWSIQAITCGPNGERSKLLGLRTSALAMAKQLGDMVAGVSHLCDDRCEDWKAVLV
jgi:hypothetical protein